MKALDPSKPSTAQKKRRMENKIKALQAKPRTGQMSRANLQKMNLAQSREGREQIAKEQEKLKNIEKEEKKALEVKVKGAGLPAYPKQGGKGGSTTEEERRKAIQKAGYNVSKKRKNREFGAMTPYMNFNFNRRK